MVIYLVTGLVDAYHAYTSYQTKIEMKETHWDNIKFTADLLYFIGCTILYINIVGRLYLTFTSTIYHLKTPVMVFIFSLITLSVCVMFMYCYIIIALDDKEYFQWSATCDLTLMIIDILLNTTILSLFVVKLRKLIRNIAINDFASSSTRRPDLDTLGSTESLDSSLLYDECTLDVHRKRRDRLITVVARHAILSCIAIICNQSFYAVNSVYYLYAANERWTAISYAGREIEGVIISLVLFLNFNFNMKIYTKLCNSCHTCCKNCFKRSTKVYPKDLRHNSLINQTAISPPKNIFVSLQQNNLENVESLSDNTVSYNHLNDTI